MYKHIKISKSQHVRCNRSNPRLFTKVPIYALRTLKFVLSRKNGTLTLYKKIILIINITSHL